MNNQDFILQTSFGEDEQYVAEGRIPIKKSLMQFVAKENRVMSVRDFLTVKNLDEYLVNQEQPLALMPLQGKDGTAIGVVNIEKINFFKLFFQIIGIPKNNFLF